jgi:hypothetical protein
VCIDNAKVIHSLEHKQQLFETSDDYGQTAKREFVFEWIILTYERGIFVR